MEYIDLQEHFIELWDFLPLNQKHEYAVQLLNNCVVRRDSEFYNNSVLNICHFYTYTLHCLLCKLYLLEDENIQLLQYIQVTNRVFNGKDDNRKFPKITSKDVQQTLFNAIEKDAIYYFFHLLNIDQDNQIFKRHIDIFNDRNTVAHLNYSFYSRDKFNTLLQNIQINLKELSKKMYLKMKKKITSELYELEKRKLISEDDYLPQIESINQQYYLNLFDYKLIMQNKVIEEPLKQNYKKYLKLYINEHLQLNDEKNIEK